MVAATAFVFPFIEIKPDYKYPDTNYSGLTLAAISLFASVGSGPLDLRRYVFMIGLIAAVGGVLYRRPGCIGSAACLVAASAGFGALAVGHSFSPQANWVYGFFGAEAGFLVAALASITSLIGDLKLSSSSSSQAAASRDAV